MKEVTVLRLSLLNGSSSGYVQTKALKMILKDFAESRATTMKEQLLDFFRKALTCSKRNNIPWALSLASEKFFDEI